MSVACKCESCCPSAPAETYTRAHALRCEARTLRAMSLEARRAYLETIDQRRRADLEAELLRQWNSPRP